jgi:hypothetical protein
MIEEPKIKSQFMKVLFAKRTFPEAQRTCWALAFRGGKTHDE